MNTRFSGNHYLMKLKMATATMVQANDPPAITAAFFAIHLVSVPPKITDEILAGSKNPTQHIKPTD